MTSQRTLRRELLAFRNADRELLGHVMGALQRRDVSAALLDLPSARASRVLSAKLWDALPGEHVGQMFGTPDEAAAAALAFVKDPDAPVTLHLGFAELAVRTSAGSALQAWPEFCHEATELFNACLYPDDLAWYVVLAGSHVYPMRCDAGAAPVAMPPLP
jgi:hypothetical protein